MRRELCRVCFVTGTRAEFGLMGTTLRAIQRQASLQLQIVVTGMHLSRARGDSRRAIERDGWNIDRVVPWPASAADPSATARNTGAAMSHLAGAFDDLNTDIVLVVGDRVEAFAAAAAGHIGGRIVAHVHGGDRAAGQVDDALRHAITKLAHVHFAATKLSAQRLLKLGEDRWRVHQVGAPGIDDIEILASSSRPSSSRPWSSRPSFSRSSSPIAGRFALVALHPADADENVEYRRAKMVLAAATKTGFERIVIVHPNNDPGSEGIARCWNAEARGKRFIVHRNLPRGEFLGLLRDAAVLVGNSSSGIIEAATFGTPVIDIGPRQRGRERSANVVNVPYDPRAIGRALAKIWNNGRPMRFKGTNVYGGGRGRGKAGAGGRANGRSAGERIATTLSRLAIDNRFHRKLITY